MKEQLCLGIIKDSFGLDGTLKIFSLTNMSEKRYKIGNKVLVVNPHDTDFKEYEVLSFRHSGNFDFVRLNGINNPEDAKLLKSFEIRVYKDYKDLDKDTYFYSDLRGCKIIDQFGNELGIVKEVEEFPAQLTLRVARKGKQDFFVPYINQFIKRIDIENKQIFIEKIEGLL